MFLQPPVPGVDQELYKEYLKTCKTLAADGKFGVQVAGWLADGVRRSAGGAAGVDGSDGGRCDFGPDTLWGRLLFEAQSAAGVGSTAEGVSGEPGTAGVGGTGEASSGGHGASGVNAGMGSKGSGLHGAGMGRASCGPAGGVTTAPRGSNYERNLVNRMRKRASRDVTARVVGGSWRDRSAAAVVLREGFFSECDDAVQTSLRESRAELLVLKNKREILEEKRKIDRLNSSAPLIEDVMHFVKQGMACAKITDNKVAGWAATVANSSSESLARSAPSSVPSFGTDSTTGSSVSQKGKKPKAADEGFSYNPGNGPSESSSGKAKAKRSSESVHGGDKPKHSSKPFVVPGTKFPSGVDQSCVDSLEDLLRNNKVDTNPGGHISHGMTKHQAGLWIDRYEYLKKHVKPGMSDVELAKLGTCSVKEVKKLNDLLEFVGKKKEWFNSALESQKK